MAKAKTAADLKADLERLTKAHEVMEKDKEATIEQLKESNKQLLAVIEKMKAAAKEERLAKAEDAKKTMQEKIKASPHQWVQVFNTGLDDGVDFVFNYEGVSVRLISGEPIFLSEILIDHLKKCGRPRVLLKQGEAGGKVRVKGFHHNFNIVNCEPPEDKKAVG